MKYEPYGNLERFSDQFEYTFTSVGPNGSIPLLIQFTKTGRDEIFNVGFGRILNDGQLDDFARINNGDCGKILATVMAAIIDFTTEWPEKGIYFSGSTASRNRLYRIAISGSLNELSANFQLYGGLHESKLYWEFFQKDRPYQVFVIKRKTNNLRYEEK